MSTICTRTLGTLDHSHSTALSIPTGSYRSYTTGSSVTPISSHPSATESSENELKTSEKLRKVLRKVPFPVVVVSTASSKDPSLRRGITVSSFTSISLQPLPLVAFFVKLPSRASTILHDSDQFVIQFLSSDQIAHSVAFSSSVPPPPSVVASLSGSGTKETQAGLAANETTSPSYKQAMSRSSRSRVPQDEDIDELVSEASRQMLIERTPENGSTLSAAAATITTASATSNATVNKDDSKRCLPESTDPDPFEVLGYETDPESNLPVLLNTLAAIRCKTHQVLVVGDHEMWVGHVEKVLHGEIPDAQEPLLYHDRSYRRVGRRIL
ncbi:hypothetical protein EDD11_007666 [Mortierella claussenii]|nr:hypothetical protein EDD11_007666 [Mortierella claussenii]